MRSLKRSAPLYENDLDYFQFLLLNHPFLTDIITMSTGARGMIQTLVLRIVSRVFYYCATGYTKIEAKIEWGQLIEEATWLFLLLNSLFVTRNLTQLQYF
jgi:hypothetical protein